MKSKLIFLAVILTVLFSCSLPVQVSFEDTSARWTSGMESGFESISNPYLALYGTPDTVLNYNSGNQTIHWIWNLNSHGVIFEKTSRGWKVLSEFDFPASHS
jgi:hypothetical protein